MIGERKRSWIEDIFWSCERLCYFLLIFIKFCKDIFIGLDRDISTIECILDIRFQGA